MLKRKVHHLVLCGFFVLSICPAVYSQWFFDAETGGAFSGYNDVQIPRDTGTAFSLSQDLKSDPALFFRLRLGIRFGKRHTLSVLAAPLTIDATGSIDTPISFFEEDFPADVPLAAVYRFNSYRLTYRYDLVRKEHLRLGVGFTAKIRDAAIRVEGDNRESEKTNVGFVPLINFYCEWFVAKNLSLLLEGDALAAPQGRAEDVLLAIRFHLSEKMALRAGYRILEGGANVEEVYNFALIHFLTAGLTYHF